MAKATDNTQVGGKHTVPAQLNVPKSAALYELLRGAGATVGAGAEKVLNAIAAVADPGHRGAGVVTLLGTPRVTGHPSEAGTAAAGLAALARKARAENHEAADLVAGLAAQLGYHEPEPAPAPPAFPAPPSLA